MHTIQLAFTALLLIICHIVPTFKHYMYEQHQKCSFVDLDK
jgi:hypothetical protein